MDLHVFFVFVCFVFAFVLITFTLGLPLCIKIVVFFTFTFVFVCKLQSINFIDISKFIPELRLQRTFLVSKKLSFLFLFYISHKIVFLLHFAQNCFFFTFRTKLFLFF